jgi:tellurite resistance protein
MSNFLQRAIKWMSGKEDPKPAASSAPPENDPAIESTRHFLRAVARTIVLAAVSDGSQTEDEIVTARLAAKPIAALASLKESAFQALLKEASTKHQAEGEEASLQFISSNITDPESKAKIFSIAVAVTFADREIKDSEKQFLAKLHNALQLTDEDADTLQHAIEENHSQEGKLGAQKTLS